MTAWDHLLYVQFTLVTTVASHKEHSASTSLKVTSLVKGHLSYQRKGSLGKLPTSLGGPQGVAIHFQIKTFAFQIQARMQGKLFKIIQLQSRLRRKTWPEPPCESWAMANAELLQQSIRPGLSLNTEMHVVQVFRTEPQPATLVPDTASLGWVRCRWGMRDFWDSREGAQLPGKDQRPKGSYFTSTREQVMGDQFDCGSLMELQDSPMLSATHTFQWKFNKAFDNKIY